MIALSAYWNGYGYMWYWAYLTTGAGWGCGMAFNNAHAALQDAWRRAPKALDGSQPTLIYTSRR